MRKVVFISVILLLLSGCSFTMGDGLLSLPKLPAEYVELQKQYDEIQGGGSTFVSAKTGSNRQSVQLADLDADGENEVIAFFKDADGTFSIYVHKKSLSSYEQIGHLDGIGKNIKSVEYINIEQAGEKALVVSWELEETTQAAMSVYALRGGTVDKMLDFQYLEYSIFDIDMDGKDEIIAVTREQGIQRLNNTIPSSGTMNRANMAVLYKFRSEQEPLMAGVPMSIESEKVVNITEGLTSSGKRGVFIDSATSNGNYVTDVVVYHDGGLSNESIDNETGSANVTKRNINIFSQDIDRDGIIEIPKSELFLGYNDPLSTDSRWKIKWYEVKSGRLVYDDLSTFYNRLEGWYVVMPAAWEDKVSVVISGGVGVSKTTFLVPNKLSEKEYSLSLNEANMLLSVYVFTGDNRDLSNRPNLKVLKTAQNAVYAYEIHETTESKLAITAEQAEAAIRFITTNDWILEEMMP